MNLLIQEILREEIKQNIEKGKPVKLRVAGKSMRPYLRGDGNDEIFVYPCQPCQLKPGDIVLFSYRGKYLFHRIIRRKGNQLTIQGDGNLRETETAQAEEILGIVKTIRRPGCKPTSPYSFRAKIYWRIWLSLRPIRRYLLFIYNYKIEKCNSKKESKLKRSPANT